MDDNSWDGSVHDHEQGHSTKHKIKSGTKLHFFKGDFSNKVADGYDDEDIDGHDKYHQIYRKYICRVTKLKRLLDMELIIEAHSNGFLRVELRILEDDDIVNVYTTWLAYNNWLGNSRIYSEIIEVDTNLSLTLYYESFASGGGSSVKVTESQEPNEINVEDNENDDKQSVTSLSKFKDEEEKRMKHRGFRLQILKKTPIIDLLMVDESTVTNDNKLIDEIWNDFMENYKLMLSLIEDSEKSSLFTQLLNKGVPSLNEIVQSDKQIIQSESKARDRQIDVNKVNQNLIVSGLNKKQSELLFRHTFMDKNNDVLTFSANVWYIRDQDELKIQTYDVETSHQDEVYIELADFFDSNEIALLNKNLSSLRQQAKALIDRCAVVERDEHDKQYKLLFMPKKKVAKNLKKRKQSMASQYSDNVSSDSDDTEATTKYDISLGIEIEN